MEAIKQNLWIEKAMALEQVKAVEQIDAKNNVFRCAEKPKKRTRFTTFEATDRHELEVQVESFLENTGAEIVSSSLSEFWDTQNYSITLSTFYKFPEDVK
jgi:hypothetical protein